MVKHNNVYENSKAKKILYLFEAFFKPFLKNLYDTQIHHSRLFKKGNQKKEYI